MACSEANDLPPDTQLSGGLTQSPADLNSRTKNIIKLYRSEDGTESSFVKRQCMHCIDPGCVAACPFGALHKSEHGIVAWDPGRCIGCRYCEVACPFGIPKFEWDRFNPRIVKCELCRHRLATDGQPACTRVCPTSAVIFGERAALFDKPRRISIRARGDVHLHAGSVIHGDVTTRDGAVTIPAGQTSVQLRIATTDDAVSETSESFTLTTGTVTGTVTNGSGTSGTATITDNDASPTLSINDVTVNEAAGTATFTVTRSGATGAAASVNFATSNGTATAGTDYASKTGTVSFAAGETTKTFTVDITNDAVFEGSETFNVTLSNATGATISDATGVGTIQDDGTGTGGTDDDTPTLSVSSPSVADGSKAVFTVSLSNASTQDVSFTPSLTNGTATLGTDTAASSTLEVSTDGGTNWVVGIVRRVNRVSGQEARVGIQTISRARGWPSYRPAWSMNSSIAVAMPSARLSQML